MSRRMDCAVLDSFGGVLPYQVYATLVIRACSFTLVHPCREDYLSIAMSTVTGRFMLKPDLTTTNYYYETGGSVVFFLAGMSREGTRRHVKYCYNLLLYNVAATSAS